MLQSLIHIAGAGLAALALAVPAAVQEPGGQAAEATTAPATPAGEIATLRAELVRVQAQLARQELVADNARVQVARLREEARLKDELLTLGRARNAEMLTLGREILDRYKRKGFGAVLTGSEPFVQSSRVKLETLAQDYEDKLRAARFTTDTLPPSVQERMRADLDKAPAPDPADPAAAPEPAPAPETLDPTRSPAG